MKLRLNIIKLVALGLLSTPLVISSCSENIMDEINENTSNPTNVSAKFILADVITSTAFSNVGGDINTYLSSYVEHEVGTFNQLWDAERRQSQPSLASTYNNVWGSLYRAMRNAQIAIDKTSVGGSEEQNKTTLGIAQVLKAYNLALLTDMFGDVPYFEAMDINITLTPKIDKQEELYKEVNRLLDEAIVNLPKGDLQGMAGYDLLYAGDVSKWVKFANGLKARYAMRLLNVTADKNAALEDVIDYLDNSFTSTNEEAAFKVYNAQNLNPLFGFQWSRDGLAASKSIADKLIDRDDPRVRRNFTTPAWDQVDNLTTDAAVYNLLAVNGENEPVQAKYLTSTFVYSQTAPTKLLSYHEVLFLKAEAMQRLGESTASIEAVLKEAVKVGIDNAEISVKSAFVAPTMVAYRNRGVGVVEKSKAITAAEIDSYFQDEVKPLFVANPLKEIANQKYLAFFGASGESTEIYNDIRRWKAEGKELIELKNPNRFPLRLPYGVSETTANPNVQAAYGDGQYVYSDNVWWAGGSR